MWESGSKIKLPIESSFSDLYTSSFRVQASCIPLGFENVDCLVRKMDRSAYASLYETVSEIIVSGLEGCRSVPLRMAIRI